jgi:hypothetical protein
MPIRPELRHFYRGPNWKAVRRRILTRARNQCEHCGRPDRTEVVTSPDGRWAPEPSSASSPIGPWKDERGRPAPAPYRDDFRGVFVVLTVAHLNHVAGDDRPENLAALCQRCHLKHDEPQHRASRAARRREKLRNLELPL